MMISGSFGVPEIVVLYGCSTLGCLGLFLALLATFSGVAKPKV